MLQRLRYRPEIDGLRALAVVPVVLFHYFPAWLPGGFIGVDIFFVISGHLITGILWQELQSGKFSLTSFYERRVRRLFPALITCLSAVLFAGWWLLYSDEYRQIGKHVGASAAFILNWMLYLESGYFDTATIKKPLLHLWSLAVEEQFYLFWPLILYGIFRMRWPPHAVILSLAILSFCLNLWIIGRDPVADFYWPFTRFWELLLGALVALTPIRVPRLQKHLGSTPGIMGLMLIGAGFACIQSGEGFPGAWALLPTLGASLVLLPCGSGPQLTHRLLGRPLCVYIGKISYPLYLWHWPLIAFGFILSGGVPSVNARIGLTLTSLLLAIATFHGIENPIRQQKGHLSAILLLGGMIGLGLTGLLIDQSRGVPSRAINALNPGTELTQIPGYFSPASDCKGFGAEGALQSHCKSFMREGSRDTFVAWGDSSAIAWTPVLLELAKSHEVNLVVIAHESCPPLLSARKTRFDLPESAHYCHDGQLQWQVLKMIQRIKPRLIFYMGALGGYRIEAGLPREDVEFITDRPHQEANRETNQETLTRRLPETLKALSETAPVMVFRNWPLLPGDLKPNTTPTISDILHRTLAAGIYDRSYFEAQRRFIDHLLQPIASARITLFDPSPLVCGETTCSDRAHGRGIYKDRYHITPEGALMVRDPLARKIDEALKSAERP